MQNACTVLSSSASNFLSPDKIYIINYFRGSLNMFNTELVEFLVRSECCSLVHHLLSHVYKKVGEDK